MATKTEIEKPQQRTEWPLFRAGDLVRVVNFAYPSGTPFVEGVARIVGVRSLRGPSAECTVRFIDDPADHWYERNLTWFAQGEDGEDYVKDLGARLNGDEDAMEAMDERAKRFDAFFGLERTEA